MSGEGSGACGSRGFPSGTETLSLNSLKKRATELWRSVWSAILSRLAEAIVIALLAGLGAFVPPLRTWLLAEQTVVLPRLVWILLALAIALLTGDQIRRWRARRQMQVTWRDYRKDTVDGLIWVWRWNYIVPETADNEDIERFAYALIPRCPNCKANLDIRQEELICPRGHVRKLLPPTYDHDSYQPYAERIAAEIVRRIVSGEYKETLKQK